MRYHIDRWFRAAVPSAPKFDKLGEIKYLSTADMYLKKKKIHFVTVVGSDRGCAQYHVKMTIKYSSETRGGSLNENSPSYRQSGVRFSGITGILFDPALDTDGTTSAVKYTSTRKFAPPRKGNYPRRNLLGNLHLRSDSDRDLLGIPQTGPPGENPDRSRFGS